MVIFILDFEQIYTSEAGVIMHIKNYLRASITLEMLRKAK